MFPQPSHTKHAPDIRIFTPHVIHIGASDLIPIDSRRSDDEPIVAASGAASIFTSAFLLGAVTGAAAATGAAGAPSKVADVKIEAAPVAQTIGSSSDLLESMGIKSDAPLCMTCGVKMRMSGACFVCEGCGNTSGCS